jgi:transposase
MLPSMNCIKGWDRNQRHLLPDQIEDYVNAENPVRFLDAFVESLNLEQAGFVFPKEDPQGRGRPGYHPAALLKLYLYGYLYQIRSSRRLESECTRNLEVIWLLGKLRPDFKTIADFRKENAASFKKVVRQFTQLCRQLELFGGELIAIDGTKIKAQNAPSKNWSQSKLEKHLAQMEQRLHDYLAALEQADQEPLPKAAPTAAQLQEKIQGLRQRQAQARERLENLEKSGQSQLSSTDPDSRSMSSGGKHVVGYNVQGAVDAKHHMVVVLEPTKAMADQGQLAAMARLAKEQLQLKEAEVVSDGGYYTREDIKECQDMAMEPYVPEGKQSGSERAGLFGKADFTYDPQTDLYRCPAQAFLKRRRRLNVKGKIIFEYENRQACGSCALRARCTKASHRILSRWEHEERLERMARLVAAMPQKLARRKTLIEHCWGTLKWLLPGGFLVRGLPKVDAEVSLAHFAYNFKRALVVVGLEKLLVALRGTKNQADKAARYFTKLIKAALPALMLRTPSDLLFRALCSNRGP